MYTRDDLQMMNRTARERGAVGATSRAWKHAAEFLKTAPRGTRVLDFGAGRTMRHVAKYRDEFPHLIIEGYDIGDNWTRDHVTDYELQTESFDVVVCSSVVNVQPCRAAVEAVVFDLALIAGHHGVIFCSVPAMPNYSDVSDADVQVMLRKRGFLCSVKNRVVMATRNRHL
jgi:hypothetical protein